MLEPVSHNTIRSYVLRQGRITKGQRRALSKLWPRYGIDINRSNLSSHPWFSQKKPIHVEIGFGMGHTLVNMALQNPHINYIGIDVHAPGVGHALLQIEQYDLQNLRIIHDDVAKVMSACPNRCLDRIYLLFPDPWPKKKQKKRRLVQQAFVSQLITRMDTDAMLYIATDFEEYAEQMRHLLNNLPKLQNIAQNGYLPQKSHRPITKYEHRAQGLGHRIWDLGYRVSD